MDWDFYTGGKVSKRGRYHVHNFSLEIRLIMMDRPVESGEGPFRNMYTLVRAGDSIIW